MHPVVTTVARRAVKDASLILDRIARPTAGIVVLIYHRVGSGSGGAMDVAVDEFREQMRYLRDTQRVLSLDDAVTELTTNTSVRPGVVVTFDDGTTDWVDHALPILAEFGVPATFYVATQFIDRQETFPLDGRPITWAGLTELLASGLATIGSHTHSHALLDRLEPTLVAHELDRCDELIADRLHTRSQHFCYPKALAPSPAAEMDVVARYRSAVLAGTFANQPGANPHRLARSPIQSSDQMRHVRAKIAGGMGGEDRLREVINHRRYRAATR